LRKQECRQASICNVQARMQRLPQREREAPAGL